jgi:hypothetical protein
LEINFFNDLFLIKFIKIILLLNLIIPNSSMHFLKQEVGVVLLGLAMEITKAPFILISDHRLSNNSSLADFLLNRCLNKS